MDAARFDEWMNDYTGQGILGRDKRLGSPSNTPFQSDPVSPDDAVELWRGDAVAARVIETIPNEATREGWELQIGTKDAPDRFAPPQKSQPIGSNAPQQGQPPTAAARPTKDADVADEDLEQLITKQLEDIGTLSALREAMCYERAYGGGAVLLGANDFATDLREPLDLSRVRSLDWLTPLESRELLPVYYYNNPRAPKFGQPAIYRIIPYNSGASIDRTYQPTQYEIHESRLLIFPGIRVSRRMIASQGLGWGDSVLTRIVIALRDYQSGHSSASTLVSDFAQAVWKIKGLADLIAQDGPQALIQKIISIDIMRSNVRGMLVDADGEDFERKSTSVNGLPDLLDRLEKRLATMCDMPLSLLTGESPAGMNTTGNDQIRFFYDRVNSVRKLRLAPAIMRLVEILIAAHGKDPVTTPHSVKFPPLWQPTEAEVATARYTQAQADCLYITNQVASPEEIAYSRFGGPEYSFETTVDFDARADQEALVAPAVDADPKPDPIPPVIETGDMPTAAAIASGAVAPKIDE